ncbi:TIGR03088 family PEP-CTERM/XrtA system glycosyltransferase [Motilimonas pumila]|uniref:TIGR03088 family PEP-CTERM/XrtA system glycosyltransferase n=1 Tax=Motilimonas pumila TaxID=2303987 RepID=A0A418YH96_9GAMM|nr:TIGR03088 family PEP-CTERM/XrtA system glycosyltransferase [Motilimonas pumila]RJG49460.1 TIGR03088 family PEP-CTERM/XrtA system glycosyltransferase [Motilimonas pumila]
MSNSEISPCVTEVRTKPIIMHLVYRFYAGGLENGMVNIINHMAPEQVEHVIVCLTDHDDFIDRIEPEIQVFDLHKKPGVDASVFYRFAKLLRQIQPDIVHSRNLATLELQWVAALTSKAIRCHGEHGWDIADLTGGNKKYRYLRRLTATHLAAIVALSAHTHDYLRRLVGIPERKLHQICNGVDHHKFSPFNTASHVADTDRVTFGTVGRLAQVKNQRLLIEAFAQLLPLATASQNLRLVLVGEGECRSELQALIERLKIGPQVELVGEQTDVAHWINQFSVFVLPSLAEGICNTILEAMACAKPVIATRVGGNDELVKDGETGVLVPSDDVTQLCQAMQGYLLSPERINRHGLQGRCEVESRFTLPIMVSKYQRLYGDLLEQNHQIAMAQQLSHREAQQKVSS